MIELKNVCAAYGKGNVLHDVSLRLPKEKLIAIVGLNGSGKSTLLKTAVGILPTSAGEFIIDGCSASDMSRIERARKVSYLAQGKSTPDMTVKQMVLHGRFPHLRYPRRYGKDDMRTAENAMRQMGIADIAERSVSSLSGGMRQKTYIAMALAQDTDYILLDEPTTYLDISGQLELMKVLRDLTHAGKGVCVVMHDLPLAFRFSDEIILMHDGHVCAVNSPEEMCKQDTVRQVFGVSMRNKNDNDYYYAY